MAKKITQKTTIFILIFLVVISLITYLINNSQFNKHTTNSIISNIDGHYENCSNSTCNFIDINTIDNQIFAHGQAYYVYPNGTQANTGEIRGKIQLHDNQALFNDESCQINMQFDTNSVTLTETKTSVCGGLNVTFNGTYVKTK